MLKIHKEYKTLAVITIKTIEEINKKNGSGKPLSEAVLEFGQFLGLLATVGGNDLDGGDGDDKSDTAQGGGADTGGKRF